MFIVSNENDRVVDMQGRSVCGLLQDGRVGSFYYAPYEHKHRTDFQLWDLIVEMAGDAIERNARYGKNQIVDTQEE